MTRINGNIPPALLSDNHLRAEFKEIHRLEELFKIRVKNGTILRMEDYPKKFTLGKGHLLFFIPRGQFIRQRYWDLAKELKERDITSMYKPKKDFLDCYLNYPELTGDWDDIWSEENNRINKEVVKRIIDKMVHKIQMSKTYHLFYGGLAEHPATTIKRLLNSLT